MAGQEPPKTNDVYRTCEGSCTHDLARGVLVSELLNDEGPYPDCNPLLGTSPVGAASVLRALIVPAAS